MFDLFYRTINSILYFVSIAYLIIELHFYVLCIIFQIQIVLQDMKDKFQTMSDQILSRNILFQLLTT